MKHDEQIGRLLTQYGAPQVDNTDAFFAEYKRLAYGFPIETVTAAVNLILKAHVWQTWPKPAEWDRACREAKATVAAAVVRLPDPDPYPEWSPARQRQAGVLIRGELGRRAAAEGWISGLWDFCRINQRLPRDLEIARLRETTRATEEEFRRARNDDTLPGNLLAVLMRLRGTLAKRRTRLACVACGELPVEACGL